MLLILFVCFTLSSLQKLLQFQHFFLEIQSFTEASQEFNEPVLFQSKVTCHRFGSHEARATHMKEVNSYQNYL